MAVGKRPEGRQEELFVATNEIRRLSHPFYQALERMLKTEGFDAFAEQACCEFYAEKNGRPGIPPGVYFRMLLIGYLEGIGSERGIAWRCADSISLREFLGYGLAKNPPDHSSVSRTRRRLSLEAHEAVFGWVLERLRSSGLLSGKTLGVDSTTLEANAALRSIVRRDDGTGYDDWLEELAKASGIETPTRSELAKLDRKRPKKGSNDDWTHPGDSEAPDHEDEGWPHASGTQAGAGVGHGLRGGCGGDGADDGRGRLCLDAGHAGGSRHSVGGPGNRA